MVESTATDPGSPASVVDGPAHPGSALDRNARLRAALSSHFTSVWRMVQALGVPAASAEDVAQRVYLLFSNKLDQVRLGSERAYLMAAAVRMAANARRQLARSLEHPSDDIDGAADPGPDAEGLLEAKQARRLLDQVLASMSYEQREVFLLFELEQLSLTEAAEALGVPRGTAASRLRAARSVFQAGVQRLRSQMARSGGHR